MSQLVARPERYSPCKTAAYLRGDEENAMRNETLLRLSAVVFAVLWTLLMWWSRGPMDTIPFIILALCGAIAGGLWYWLYGKWFRWYIGQ
jgi:hypothetical protein